MRIGCFSDSKADKNTPAKFKTYCDAWEINAKADKTKIVVFNVWNCTTDGTWKVGNESIQHDKDYK